MVGLPLGSSAQPSGIVLLPRRQRVADARARDHRGRHVGDDRIGAGQRKGGADRIGAEQPLGAAGRRDRRHGIGEGKADQAVLGGALGVIAGGAEVARVAHRHRAQAVLLGDVDRHIGRALARHQAEAVVGVHHRAARQSSAWL